MIEEQKIKEKKRSKDKKSVQINV